MDEYVYYACALTLDGFITLYFSFQYLAARKLFKIFLNSLNEGINSISNNEEINKNSPNYAVVQGHIKALGPPIKSLHESSVLGVIQKLTVKEYVTKKNNVGVWLNQERIIDEKCNVVPFELKNNQYEIAVTSPLDAKYLNLDIIKDHFEPSTSNILGLIFGIHQKGFQYTEYLLKEDTVLTGFGEITIGQNGYLKLNPPKNGISYILTTMDPETLTKTLNSDKKYYGIGCAVFSIIGLIITGLVTYKWWGNYRRRKQLLNMNKRAQFNRESNISKPVDLNTSFTCIICCTNPREVVFLPCGHISLCSDCSLQCINRPCPVCRSEVSNVNLIFIS